MVRVVNQTRRVMLVRAVDIHRSSPATPRTGNRTRAVKDHSSDVGAVELDA